MLPLKQKLAIYIFSKFQANIFCSMIKDNKNYHNIIIPHVGNMSKYSIKNKGH